MANLKCNKCNKKIDIIKSDVWEIIEVEGNHNINCPECKEDIIVNVVLTYELECVKE